MLYLYVDHCSHIFNFLITYFCSTKTFFFLSYSIYIQVKTHSFSIQPKISLTEEHRTPTRQFVEVGDIHHLGEFTSEEEDTLQSQFLDRRMPSNEVDWRINAIVAPLATQLETLIQPMRELRERNSNRSTEGATVSERSRSSGRRSDTEFCSFVPPLLSLLDFLMIISWCLLSVTEPQPVLRHRS